MIRAASSLAAAIAITVGLLTCPALAAPSPTASRPEAWPTGTATAGMPALAASRQFPSYNTRTGRCANFQQSPRYTGAEWQTSVNPYESARPGTPVEIGLRDKYGEIPETFPMKVLVRTPQRKTYKAWVMHVRGDGWADTVWPRKFRAPRSTGTGVYTVVWRDSEGRNIYCVGFVVT